MKKDCIWVSDILMILIGNCETPAGVRNLELKQG